MVAVGVRRVREIKPHSKPSRISRLDRRSAEWRRMETIRAGLMDQLAGQATATQLGLIDRVVTLTVLTEAFERRCFRENGGIMSERDQRAHLSYSNALSRALRALGLRAAARPVPSLAELFAADGAEAAA